MLPGLRSARLMPSIRAFLLRPSPPQPSRPTQQTRTLIAHFLPRRRPTTTSATSTTTTSATSTTTTTTTTTTNTAPSPWRSIRSRSQQRHNSSSPLGPLKRKLEEKAPQGLQAKLKELSRKYGWAAFGVYMGLSALDFPFCFLAVRVLGPERVGQAEHFVVDRFWKVVGLVTPSMAKGDEVVGAAAEEEAAAKEVVERESRVVENAKKDGGDGATIWTQLLLAYGVHKSLIFFRVPLTAAVTPKVVKFLRARGWNIGRPSTSP